MPAQGVRDLPGGKLQGDALEMRRLQAQRSVVGTDQGSVVASCCQPFWRHSSLPTNTAAKQHPIRFLEHTQRALGYSLDGDNELPVTYPPLESGFYALLVIPAAVVSVFFCALAEDFCQGVFHGDLEVHRHATKQGAQSELSHSFPPGPTQPCTHAHRTSKLALSSSGVHLSGFPLRPTWRICLVFRWLSWRRAVWCS